MEKRRMLSLYVAIGMILGLSPTARACFTNGGFEDGDLSGWNVKMKGGKWKLAGETELQKDFSTLPFSIFDKLPQYAPELQWENGYAPVQGGYYLRIPGVGLWPISVEHEGVTYDLAVPFVTSLVYQKITIDKGDTVSGFMAFKTYETPDYEFDRAFVRIWAEKLDDTVAVIGIQEVWGGEKPPPNPPRQSEWQAFQWIAPRAGTYTVELSNNIDDQMESHAYFDALKVRKRKKTFVRSPHGTEAVALNYVVANGTVTMTVSAGKKASTMALYDLKGARVARVKLDRFRGAGNRYSVPLKSLAGNLAASTLVLSVEGEGFSVREMVRF